MARPKGFDLRALEVFIAVVEMGSMASAARKLGMTQSAVSQHITNLEGLLDASLIDRKLRPLRPTPTGLVLRDRAALILARAEEAVTAVVETEHSPLPELRLAVVDSLAGSLVPHLAEVITKEPRVRSLSVRSGLALDHGQALLNRDVDLIITTDALEDVRGLDRYELMREPFVLLLPPQITMDEPSLSRLADEHPLIRYSSRSIIGLQIERHLRRLRLSPPRRFEFDLSQSLVAMVAEGFGWAITTPVCLLDCLPTSSEVRSVAFPGPGFSRRIMIVGRTGELGHLPAELAQICTAVLRAQCLPRIRALLPWINDQVLIA